MDCGGKNIDPLIYTVVAYNLCTQQTIGFFLKYHFHRHDLATGIVAGMAHGRENYGVYGDPSFFSIGFIDSRGRSSHIKHLDHGATLATKIVAVATANIVGSNTANIALILGVGLLLGGAIGFERKVVWRDMLLLLALGCGLMFWYLFGVDMPQKYGFGRVGGAVLLAVCAAYSILLCRETASEESGEDAEPVLEMSRWKASGLIVLALVMITVGAKCMVDTVVWSAVKLGVSELMISLTIVAIGTSLPELAVTVSGILKKRDDIALGNIIGSGIYNIVLIIGACSLVNPLTGNGKSGLTSMLIMNAVALLLFAFMLPAKKLYRWQGIVFLLIYAGFTAWTILCVK